MKDPRSRLERYMQDESISQCELASRTRCSAGMISAVIKKKKLPGLKLAHAIELETLGWKRGPILAEKWIGLPLDAPRKKQAA